MPDRPAPSPNAPPVPDAAHERSLGLASGVSAYLIWGFFPLLFALVAAAGPLEILAHRVVWSLAAVSLALALLRRPWGWLRTVFRGPRFVRLVAATVLVAVNWLTFIWAVNSGHVVEASLGYFINPLVSVALGALFLRERLRPLQAAAVAIACAGVGWRVWQLDSLPWIALFLAGTFGLYGLLRKRAPVEAASGLFIETLLVAPLALAWLVWVGQQGGLSFGSGARTDWLLPLTGVITAVPLMLFAVGARRLPLATVGFLQYLAPSLNFLVAVLVFREPLDATQLVGFALIWCALAVYSFDLLRAARRPAPRIQ